MKDAVEMLNEKQAAQYLGLSVRTLQGYRCQMRPPAWIKLGRAVRYLRSDLDRFLNSNRVEPAK